MCTVTYLPLDDQRYILSSNRDESPSRATNQLVIESINDRAVLCPQDVKGGSWFYAADNGWALCLLNGAFVKHKHQPPYRMSRGLLLKQAFTYDTVVDFMAECALDGIEPFTIVIRSENQLFELRWNGRHKHIETLRIDETYIWSSATLYDADMQRKRAQWFETWLKERDDLSLDAIHTLHRTGGEGDIENDYVMNRNNRVCTVSITHLEGGPDGLQMTHYDLLGGQHHTKRLAISIPARH